MTGEMVNNVLRQKIWSELRFASCNQRQTKSDVLTAPSTAPQQSPSLRRGDGKQRCLPANPTSGLGNTVLDVQQLSTD